MKHTHTSQGFTLLELLVALALLGILGTAMAGVLKNAIASVDQGSLAMDHLTRMRSLDALLGGALRDARIVTVSSKERSLLADDPSFDPADGRFRFRGEEHMLGFVLDRPFLAAERDGHLHWVTIEARLVEDTDHYAIWLRDVSYLPGIDNPVGPDWSDADFQEDALPARELVLLENVRDVSFRYWRLVQSGFTGEPEPEEMEPEDLDTDYAVRVPDFIELFLDLPKTGAESLMFDYSLRRMGL